MRFTRKPQPVEHTPEQQDHLVTRTLHDAELIKSGAGYDKFGRLGIYNALYLPLIVEMDRELTGRKVEKFLQESAQGQQIAAHLTTLDKILKWGVPHRDSHVRFLDDPEPISAHEAKTFVKENNLVKAEHALNEWDWDSLCASVESSQGQLRSLAEELTLFPRYDIGDTVDTVRFPNGLQGGKVREDCVVTGITAAGAFRVENAQGHQEDVGLPMLDAWNGYDSI
ncbi:MAG TPA: hypothetical protein VF401_03545 [Candidatus Saccharimonadales bacterium]